MSIRFILGRTGTGKTQLCLDEITSALARPAEGPPLILLVPEQATFSMEQSLVRRAEVRGIIRAQVLSFRRLAWRVLRETGGSARPILGDLGKLMVLRAIVEDRRGELRLFDKVAGRPGFIEKLARSVKELREYRRGPGDLLAHLDALERQGKGDTPLARKLADLALVLAALEDYTRDRFLDPDERLSLLAGRIPGSRLLARAEVWIDGFASFTPQELQVLSAIFRSATRVNLTLCLDGAEAAEAGERLLRDRAYLFHPSLATYVKLREIAREAGAPIVPATILDDAEKPPARFRGAPELARLERELFRAGRPRPSGEAAARVAVRTAPGRREEVEAAAREILRLARTEGMRFREMAVVVPEADLDAYADLVVAIFREHGISAFVDRRRPVPHHPLVELIRAALETVVFDWPYEAVFRFLKTDLVPVSRDEIDILENYVLEHGIRGERWVEGGRWEFFRRRSLLEEEEEEASAADQAEIERVNDIRARATRALASFERRLGMPGRGRGGGTPPRRKRPVREIAKAVHGLLEDLGVAATLEGWITEAEEAGDPDRAEEHEQVWRQVLTLADEMVEALGDREMAADEFLEVVESGLEGIRLGLIPPGLDQVVVGTIERSRHFGIRASLLIGATERSFPATPPEDAILCDEDRERLAAAGIDLAPTSRDRLFHEQYFAYLALTRASERLWVSSPAADEEGRPLPPSPVVRRLLDLLPGAGGPGAPAADPLATVATLPQLAAALARNLRRARGRGSLDPVWLDLYGWVAEDEAARRAAAPVLAALDYESRYRDGMIPLGEDLARRLYGDQFRSSVSRLESFAACPFQHFARHGLALEERQVHRAGAPEVGLLYHAALALFVRRLMDGGRDWAELSEDEAGRIMDTIVDELAARLKSEILLSDPQNRYLLRVIRRTLARSLVALGEHARRGRFRPAGVEVRFGRGGRDAGAGDLPPFVVGLPEGGTAELRGRIDRVDSLEADGERYIRVIDYKSGKRKLALDRVYHGLDLQLPVYLAIAAGNGERLAGGPARAAGALYFRVHDPIVKREPGSDLAAVETDRLNAYKTTGIVLADPRVIRWMDGSIKGHSAIIPVGLGEKNNNIYVNSSTASLAQFETLFGFLEAVIVRLVVRIRQGEIAIKPFRRGEETACARCPMRSVCQFDPTIEGEEYWEPESMKKDEVWQRMERERAQ